MVWVGGLAVLYLPISFLFYFGFMWLGFIMVDKFLIRSSDGRARTVSVGYAVVILTVTVVIAGAGAVWLPEEVFVTDMSEGSFVVGYTLSESDGWLTFLEDESRTVHRVRSELVEERYFCFGGNGSWYFKSVIQTVSDSTVPDCPSPGADLIDSDTGQGTP